ncbi:unnamed protein product [Thlaspi arvense]|uniref:Uncharacterized protein n=1 Tax=Thlaspi arvense TaxID=13288 RepID=A0AAU9SBN5_THLAR|nr:unnamed protein product [Thlaspi arvense]
MALSAAFKERLDQMEFTRNQRLHLLQAEKELQVNKSQILASKHATIQSIERKCLMLEQKIAAQNLKITILRSSIEDLDSKYNCSIQQLRTLKSEIQELKELDEEREKYYKLKCSEMKEFIQNVERFRSENRFQVENLRNQIKEVNAKKKKKTMKSSFKYSEHETSYEDGEKELALLRSSKTTPVLTFSVKKNS